MKENTSDLWKAWTELTKQESWRTGTLPCVCVQSPCDCQRLGDLLPPQPWEPDLPWEPETSPHTPSPTDVIPWRPQYEDPDYETSPHKTGMSVTEFAAIAGLFLIIVGGK